MRLTDRLRRYRAHRRPSGIGLPATALAGTDLEGAPVEIPMDGRWAVLFFLTSGCYGCQAIWEGFAARASQPPDPAVVLVTPSPSTESVRRVANLAAGGVPLVMSSQAWHNYAVTGSPWCVVVAGGVVVAHGPAPASWSGVEDLLRPGRP